jgi:hypothetical protein
VELGLCIGVDGKPEQIHVIKPIGYGLDEQAIAALLMASSGEFVGNWRVSAPVG